MLARDWIKRVRPGLPIRDRYYVVCSEECFSNVKKALDTIYARNHHHYNYEVLIAVDKLILSSDVISITDSKRRGKNKSRKGW